jgi:hypothetical protein
MMDLHSAIARLRLDGKLYTVTGGEIELNLDVRILGVVLFIFL